MWHSAVGGIVTLVLSLLAAPLTSQAQPAAHVPRLGMLIPSAVSAVASRLEAFRHGLRDLGYGEGRTITLEYRFADGQADRLPALVTELNQSTGDSYTRCREHTDIARLRVLPVCQCCVA